MSKKNRKSSSTSRIKTALQLLQKYIAVTFGCFLYAFGFFAFVNSAGITTGGVTGLVNVVNMIHPIPIGLVVMAINIPLLIVSLIVYKWRFTASTIYGAIVSSLFITLCENTMSGIFPVTENTLISGIIGGIMTGAGLAITLRFHASTGGTDIIIKLLHKKWRHISGGTFHIIIDGLILGLFFIVTKNFDATVYALITIVVSNTVYDIVLYGVNTSKTVYIITGKTQEMITRILEQCDCGATILNAEGAYTHENKQVILCVVKKASFPKLKDIIHECDKHAFVIVNQSAEIYGEGFSEYKDVLI